MMAKFYRFEPLDRVFFRGPRPFNAGESLWAEPEFPPSPRVMQGAIRSAIGESLEVDWLRFRAGDGTAHRLGKDNIDLVEQMGNAHGLGRLRLAGPFMERENEMLYPAPLDLYQSEGKFGLLRPADEPVDTDIGSVRLPRGEGRGLKVLEGHFISQSAMSRLLAGQLEGISHAYEEGDSGGTIWPAFAPEGNPEIPALADLESHVGLGRDNATRRHVDGMLYGISLIRLRLGVRFAVRVEGVDERIHPSGCPLGVSLGGEGKLARLVVDDARPWPEPPELKTGADGKLRFRIVLTTPACMPEKGWLPEEFAEVRGSDGSLRWEGSLNGVECSIVSACIGKAVPMGGWNMAEGRPRPLQPHVPAGSVYFCEADVSQIEGIRNLHGSHMGQNTAFGFGHILIGCW